MCNLANVPGSDAIRSFCVRSGPGYEDCWKTKARVSESLNLPAEVILGECTITLSRENTETTCRRVNVKYRAHEL